MDKFALWTHKSLSSMHPQKSEAWKFRIRHVRVFLVSQRTLVFSMEKDNITYFQIPQKTITNYNTYTTFISLLFYLCMYHNFIRIHSRSDLVLG